MIDELFINQKCTDLMLNHAIENRLISMSGTICPEDGAGNPWPEDEVSEEDLQLAE